MTPELRKLIALERGASGPDHQEAEGTWRRVKHSLAAGAAAPFELSPLSVELSGVGKLMTTLSMPVVKWTAAISTVAIVAAAVGLSPDDDQPATAERTELIDPHHEVKPVPASPEPQVPVELEHRDVVSVDADVAPAVDAQRPSPAVDSVAPPGSRPRRPKVPQDADRDDAHRGSTFEDELDLIRGAQTALGEGDAGRARAYLRRHRSQYRRGVLAQDREAMRVIVLCELGKTEQALEVRRRFERQWPASVHIHRVRQACASR